MREINSFRSLLDYFIVTFILIVAISCSDKNSEAEANATNDMGVYSESISLSDVNTDLDEAAGKELCKKYCITCHSLRYIEMQPAFPKEAWMKIVDKMVHTFGAQIPDTSVIPIVEYLVRIRGKEK